MDLYGAFHAPYKGLLFNPLRLAANVLDRPVLNAQLDGGRTEEAASQRLGEHLRQRRFQLRHFLRVRRCLAGRDHYT